jgi:SAM-dependent methyltransferase
MGFAVTAMDIPASNYADARVFPILEYDGSEFPFPDQAFDVVYTSNLLEHVNDLASMHAEIRRVLAPGGKVLHVLPTHSWRLWTLFTEVMGRHRPKRHGERGNLVTESWYFHPRWWRRHFASQGFCLIADGPVGLFYTGVALLGPRLGMKQRSRLASRLGSAGHWYLMTPDRR